MPARLGRTQEMMCKASSERCQCERTAAGAPGGGTSAAYGRTPSVAQRRVRPAGIEPAACGLKASRSYRATCATLRPVWRDRTWPGCRLRCSLVRRARFSGGKLPAADDRSPSSGRTRAIARRARRMLLLVVRSGWLRWHAFGRHTERGRFASQRSEMRSIHLRVEDDLYHEEG